jgi:hypothetical protein
MRTALTIHLMSGVIIIIAILIGVLVAQEGCKQNARLNEYEFLLADAYQAQQECRDQLGVFYKEPE